MSSTTIVYSVDTTEYASDFGAGTLAGQTFQLASAQLIQSLSFSAIAFPDDGSFMEYANFYVIDPTTNAYTLIAESPLQLVSTSDTGPQTFAVTLGQPVDATELAVSIFNTGSANDLVIGDNPDNPYANGTEVITYDHGASYYPYSGHDIGGTLIITGDDTASVSSVAEPSAAVLMGATLALCAIASKFAPALRRALRRNATVRWPIAA